MNRAVVFYGLADYSVHEIIEFYASREEAERTLREVLVDEPGFSKILGLVEVDVGTEPWRVDAVAS